MNRIGNFITSVKAILIALLFIIVALVFDSHTLFIRTLPADMGYFSREVTSWGMAIAFEFTVLLTTANGNFVRRSTHYFLAFCTLMTTLFFFDVFAERDLFRIFQIVFVSIMIAYVNFIYAELFVKKWKEYKASIDSGNHLTKQLLEFENQLNLIESVKVKLQESNVELQEKLSYETNNRLLLESNIKVLNKELKSLNQVCEGLQIELNIAHSKLSRKREKSSVINN